jgi:PD-(D/E)XK nuclease superfamily
LRSLRDGFSVVLVEVEAIDVVLPVHRRQVNTYIRLGDYRVGLLLNSGAAIMKYGIERIVNRFLTRDRRVSRERREEITQRSPRSRDPQRTRRGPTRRMVIVESVRGSPLARALRDLCPSAISA